MVFAAVFRILHRLNIDKLVESLDAKDEIYIRILTYALKDEYVSFRTFSQGTWNIKF